MKEMKKNIHNRWVIHLKRNTEREREIIIIKHQLVIEAEQKNEQEEEDEWNIKHMIILYVHGWIKLNKIQKNIKKIKKATTMDK